MTGVNYVNAEECVLQIYVIAEECVLQIYVQPPFNAVSVNNKAPRSS
jgi:hypothetical protein